MKKIIFLIIILFLSSCSLKKEIKYEDLVKFANGLANSEERALKILMLINNGEGERMALRQYDKLGNIHFVDQDYNYYSVDGKVYQYMIVTKTINKVTTTEEYLEEIKDKKVQGFKNNNIQGIETYNDTKKQIGTILDSLTKNYDGKKKAITHRNKNALEISSTENKNDKVIIYKENDKTLVIEMIVNSKTSVFIIEVGHNEIIELPNREIK